MRARGTFYDNRKFMAFLGEGGTDHGEFRRGRLVLLRGLSKELRSSRFLLFWEFIIASCGGVCLLGSGGESSLMIELDC